MKEINYQLLPNFGLFIWTIILGMALIAIYLVLKKMFLPVFASGNARKKVLDRVRYAEKIFWPVFLIILGINLILSHAIVGLSLCVFIATIFWKSINNYFLGLLYGVGDKYKIGQRIRYEDKQGTICAFNNLSLEMELEHGDFLDIPYRHFAEAIIVRTSPQSGIMSHSISMKLTKPCDLEKEKQRLKNRLLTMPWVLPNQKIAFELMAEELTHYRIKVKVQGIDKEHLDKVERQLRDY